MKKISKIVSIVLALVMCMSLCAFASAASTQSRSESKDVKVKTYALAINVGDDLILWDEDSVASTTISVTNGSGTRDITTKVLLQVGGKTVKTVEGTTVTAADIKAAAGTTDQVVVVEIVTSESKVTKNGIESTPTEATAAQVIVMNNIDGDDVDEDDPEGVKTTGLLVSTITVDVTEAFPGDEIKVDGATDKTALQTKLGSTATVTVTSTKIYAYNGKNVTCIATGVDSASAVDHMENVAQMTYWVVGVATISE